MPAGSGWIREGHGIAPGLAAVLEVGPFGSRRCAGQCLVPAGICKHHRIGTDALPVMKIIRDNRADPLVEDVMPGCGDRGIEHPPLMMITND